MASAVTVEELLSQARTLPLREKLRLIEGFARQLADAMAEPPSAALVLRGTLSNSRHIELDEPTPGVDGEVEVVLRRVATSSGPATVDAFELIAATVPGIRSKEDIDRQLADERGLWGDRCALGDPDLL